MHNPTILISLDTTNGQYLLLCSLQPFMASVATESYHVVTYIRVNRLARLEGLKGEEPG
jgi:hypothetical protein